MFATPRKVHLMIWQQKLSLKYWTTMGPWLHSREDSFVCSTMAMILSRKVEGNPLILQIKVYHYFVSALTERGGRNILTRLEKSVLI